ncbi:MAG TPA: phenylalanine--tRNA ligase subunit beta [Nocardioidaceae bacterium]|nr:phenylalanine--tRNA ligase subunit beta [Nocardioidaceae bacterium]
MRAPVSWIRDYAALPTDVAPAQLAARLTGLGLKLESLSEPGSDLSGPLVVGRVLSRAKEEHRNGKAINWCRVDVGPDHNPPAAAGSGEGAAGRGIVCGAHNFDTGDLVVVALPGAVLPGGFAISARKTYGHVSDGMICSAAELGLGDDAAEIIVLTPGEAQPGDDAAALLHIRDHVIELEINPDRAYALSLRGIARDAALGYRVAFDDPAGLTVRAGEDGSYPVQVTDRDACPLFVTRTVTGFDPTAPTPRWLARRIQLAGMRPISLAVDVTNYVMLELGQPIHGYDRDRLQGAIVVRRAQPGETLRTLDGQDRRLSGEDLLITDDSGPIGLAGVMGGESTEISPATTAVVIEAAAFDPVTTARTARRHKLVSEASRRFERGVDPDLPPVAAQRVADLLVALGGGRTEPGMTVVGSVPPRSPIAIPADLPARVTGIEVDVTTTVGALRDVGCTVDGAASETLHVTPPSWRPDVTDPYDLVEEVARVVGYDQVPSVLPTAPAGRGLTTAQRLRRRIGTGLAGAGFTEVVAYPFVGEPDLDALGLAADDPRRTAPRVANPVSEREPLLHTTLAPALLKVLARNAGRGFPDSRLSLLARVFRPDDWPPPPAPVLPVDRAPTAAELAALDAAVPHQPYHLAVVVSGHPGTAAAPVGAPPEAWAEALGAVREVARLLGLQATVAADATAPWHPGRCARISIPGTGGEVIVGHAGELHPRVCRAFGLPERTAYAEVDVDLLVAAAPEVRPAPVFSTMPVAKSDVALVVDVAVPAGDVEAALQQGAGPLLESIRLFDVYTGEQVPPGRKSLAYALRFRAPDRTLTDEEVAGARAMAVAAAAERFGATLRD